MRKPDQYPAHRSLWAALFSSSLALAGIGVNAGEADASTGHYHPDVAITACIPGVTSASNDTEAGPSVNALATIITKIRAGKSVEVTSKPVALTEPGPVAGKGYPIVYKVAGVACFAFTNDDPQIQNRHITPLEEARSAYTIYTEPAGDKHIPLEKATEISGEFGVLENQSGDIVGWSKSKYTNPGCSFDSCPSPDRQAT